MTETSEEHRNQEREQRREEAISLHEIEGNPFTREDNALFEMFDWLGWNDAQRREYLVREAKLRAEVTAAAE